MNCLKERQTKILNAIKNKGNYCSKCDFTYIPMSEYTDMFCPKCEKDKIKLSKEITRNTLNFIDAVSYDDDLDDDLVLNVVDKPWLNEE